MPVATEYRVQKTKQLFKRSQSTKEIVDALGKPTKTVKGPTRKKLHNGTILDLSSIEEAWIYNREGIPYWLAYLITEDGSTIKSYEVDRLW